MINAFRRPTIRPCHHNTLRRPLAGELLHACQVVPQGRLRRCILGDAKSVSHGFLACITTLTLAVLAQTLLSVGATGVNVQPDGLNISPSLIAVTPGRVSVNAKGGGISPVGLSVTAP